MTDKLQIDSHIVCEHCKETYYTLWRVRVPDSEAWVHRLWPAEGPWREPPHHPTELTCRSCGSMLKRSPKRVDRSKV